MRVAAEGVVRAASAKDAVVRLFEYASVGVVVGFKGLQRHFRRCQRAVNLLGVIRGEAAVAKETVARAQRRRGRYASADLIPGGLFIPDFAEHRMASTSECPCGRQKVERVLARAANAIVARGACESARGVSSRFE